MLLFFMGTQTILIVPVHIQMRPGRINVVSIFRIEFPVIVLGTVSTAFSSATVMAGYPLSSPRISPPFWVGIVGVEGRSGGRDPGDLAFYDR